MNPDQVFGIQSCVTSLLAVAQQATTMATIELPSSPKKLGAKNYIIPDRYAVLATAGVAKAKKDLDLTSEYLKRDITGQYTLTTFIQGSAVIEDNTKDGYEKQARGLRYFCAMVGDYTSLLMLEENSVFFFCPSMNPDTIVNMIE